MRTPPPRVRRDGDVSLTSRRARTERNCYENGNSPHLPQQFISRVIIRGYQFELNSPAPTPRPPRTHLSEEGGENMGECRYVRRRKGEKDGSPVSPPSLPFEARGALAPTQPTNPEPKTERPCRRFLSPPLCALHMSRVRLTYAMRVEGVRVERGGGKKDALCKRKRKKGGCAIATVLNPGSLK